MEKKKYEHAGHRDRLRKRFMEAGPDGFTEQQTLELLLSYAIPRRDTDALAGELLRRFGDTAGVLDASVGELMSVEGLGERAAVLIKLIPHVTRKYQLSVILNEAHPRLEGVSAVGNYILPHFQSLSEETVYLLCLDERCRLIKMVDCGSGKEHFAGIPMERLVAIARREGAHSVVVAHNHPGGVMVPSRDDVESTRKLEALLKAVGIELSDHFVVTQGEYMSMTECGFFKEDEDI